MGLREIHPQDVSGASTGIHSVLGRYREYKVGRVQRALDVAKWIKVIHSESGLNLALLSFLHGRIEQESTELSS